VELGIAAGAADDLAGHFRLDLELHFTGGAFELHDEISVYG
jgi:hypothetical protein